MATQADKIEKLAEEIFPQSLFPPYPANEAAAKEYEDDPRYLNQ